MPATGDLINLNTLVLTDTFNTWLNRTNQIVDSINPLQVYDVDVGAGVTSIQTGAGLAKYTGEVAGNYNGVVTIGLNPGPGIGYESLSGQSRTIVDFQYFDTYGRVLSGAGASGAATRVATNDEYIVNDVSDTTTSSKGTAKKIQARNILPPEISMDVLTISGNVIIKGSLSTFGASDFIGSNNLRIEDKQIELAYQQAIPLGLTGVTSGTFPLTGGITAYYFTNSTNLTSAFYGFLQSFTAAAAGPTGTAVIGSLFGSVLGGDDSYGPEDFGATGFISRSITGNPRYLYNTKGGITNSFLNNSNLDEGGVVLKGSEGDKSWLWIWTDNDTGEYYDSWQANSNIGVNGSSNAVISRVYRSFGYTGTDQTKSQYIFAAESGRNAEIYLAETSTALAPLSFTASGSWRVARDRSTNNLVFSVGATGISGLSESFLITPGASGATYPGVTVNNYARNFNADLLDGAHASLTAAAFTIPIANSLGRIDGSWVSSDSLRRRYTYAGHGLTFGMSVRVVPTSGGFTSAVAVDAEKGEAIGIVSAVYSSSEFEITHKGRIDNISGANMTLEGSAFVPGNVYFLGASANSPGKLIADPDYTAATRIGTGQIRKPMLLAISATQGFVMNYVGTKVPTATDQVYLYGLVPVGTIQAYAGDLDYITSEWLLCDGDVYRAVDYPELYNTIGRTYEGRITFSASGTTGTMVGGVRNMASGQTYTITPIGSVTSYTATVNSVDAATGVVTFGATVNCGAGTHRIVPTTNSLGENLFFVPDLRTRSIVGGSTGDAQYTSANIESYTTGQFGGTENINVGPGSIPPHIHTTTTVSANVTPGSQTLVTSVGSGGVATPGDDIDNRSPYLVTHYIIRAKAETGATILTGHNHDGRYHFLNDNMKISANGNYRGFPSVAGFTGFNVYADSSLLGRTAYILSCFVPTTPYTGVLQNDSRTKTNMVGDLTIWGTGLTALNGATGAHRPTFTFSTHAAALYIEGGTANMPAPYIDFYTDGAGPQGSVRGLTLPAADTHAANKYYSDTSNKTIALTTPTGEWSVKHNALALNRSAQSSKILTVGYNQNLAVSGLDSVCQTTVYGDFTVYGDGLTTGTNKTGHSSVTFAVDPLSSSVSIEGSSNNPGKPAPALVFVNSSNINNPIGIIAGLTAPTTNDRAANKWYVDNNEIKYFEYSSLLGISAPYTKNLNSDSYGIWYVNMEGTCTDAFAGSDSYAIGITVNSKTIQLNILNHPDGTAPISMSAIVMVDNATPKIEITNITNMILQNIVAYKIGGSATIV